MTESADRVRRERDEINLPSNCKPDRLVNNAPATEKPFPQCDYPIAIPSWMKLIVDKMTLLLVRVRLIVYVQTRFVLITSLKRR
jgi:hypothetical protein